MSGQSSRGGFTLVEAVISSLLMVVVIAASYMVSTNATRMVQASRDHYVAMNISGARFERMRNFPYNQLYTLAGTNVVDDSGNLCPTGLYQRVTEIQTNYNSNPGLTKITIKTFIADMNTNSAKRFWNVNLNESVSCLFTEYLTR